ncbi:MAG: HlyD family secretion protein [Gammaproteobacteria bacterium]|nr:HlyD family secretion protein [Pseudomonadales bacterium]MCP5349002.1 HlyD family secretion protein [Pseudomonadales bacterium]
MSTSEVKTKKSPGLLRKIRHLVLLLLGPAVIAVGGVFLYLHGGRYVSTDNAYVKTEIRSISSNVAGMVMQVLPRESQWVTAGELLLKVDDQPFLIAVARSEANLATVRGDIESLKAELENRLLEIAKAETDLEFRTQEYERIRSLYEQNSISGVQYDQADYAKRSAERSLAEKRQARQVLEARLIDPALPTDVHPRVKQALAELEKARLDLSHVEVRAPVDGVVANISTHVGENVIAGAPLMSLINSKEVWLEANFKETDLTHLRIGKTAEVSIDTYPDQSWRGTVASISPATGSEFSLLPAQNSTGNWVKVVQRIKVRISLDDFQSDLPLASGMSAEVSVDTGHQRTLPQLAQSR